MLLSNAANISNETTQVVTTRVDLHQRESAHDCHAKSWSAIECASEAKTGHAARIR
jgi:hypothetical protein